MQLDRFTQKAQEAVLAAQQTAERMHSPVLDAEHLLSALLEPDDGIPAETLRRLGVDLPAFRGELAAILAKRARIEGGSLTLDPREGIATMTSFIVRIAQGDVQHGSTDFNSLFAVAGVLFVMTLSMNIAAQWVVRRYRQVYQ